MSAKKCATIKVIFKENWPDFKQKHSGRIRKTVIEDVEKMRRYYRVAIQSINAIVAER